MAHISVRKKKKKKDNKSLLFKEDAEASSPPNHSLKSVLTKKNILGQIKKERNCTSKEPQDLTTAWQEKPVEYIWILDPEGYLSGGPEHKVGYKKLSTYPLLGYRI